MQYLSHLIHAILMFVTPLKFLGYKSTVKQKALFTAVYGLCVIFSRRLYDFFPLPFGTHTILLIIVSIVLFKTIMKEFSWKKSIYTSLILFIILLINDSLIVLPIMNIFNLTVDNLNYNSFLGLVLTTILSDLGLILGYMIGCLKNRNSNSIVLNS